MEKVKKISIDVKIEGKDKAAISEKANKLYDQLFEMAMCDEDYVVMDSGGPWIDDMTTQYKNYLNKGSD